MSELIDAHVRHLKAAGASANTIRDRTRLLKALHAYLPFGLAYASTEELEDFLQSDPTWEPWTVHTYAVHARAFYRWANGRWLNGDPTADMAFPPAPDDDPHPVTEEQLAIALTAPDPWHTLITLGAYAGLRASEAAGVHREDVTEETIRIRRAKGGKRAAIDTHPKIWQLVCDRPPGPLCRTPRGKPMTARWIGSNGRKFFDSLGMPEVTFHRFRHWYATALLDAGNDLRTVQEAMRHKSIVSTQKYTLVGGGQRRLAIRSLPDPTRPSAESRSAD